VKAVDGDVSAPPYALGALTAHDLLERIPLDVGQLGPVIRDQGLEPSSGTCLGPVIDELPVTSTSPLRANPRFRLQWESLGVLSTLG